MGVLEEVELVLDDAASGSARLQTEPEWLPPVHAGRCEARALPAAELRADKLVQRLFFSDPSQTTAVRRSPGCSPPSETCPSSPGKSHPPPSASAPACGGAVPTLPDSADRSRAPWSPAIGIAAPPTGRGTLASLSHHLFEAPAEGRLEGQLLDLFHPHPTFRTAQPMHLHGHGRAIHAPWQVADCSFPHIPQLVRAPPTSATLKPPVHRLAPHPQFQGPLRFLALVGCSPLPD
jgi:hypothetical protein